MRLVIGTHAYLALVRLDEQWKIADLEVLETGPHYGVALPREDGSQFLAMTLEEEVGRITRYEGTGADPLAPYRLVESYTLPGTFRDLHQIAFCDGGIYAANTYYNNLVYMGLDGSQRQDHFFRGYHNDISHLNSIYPCGSGQVITMLHNRQRRDSEVAVLERDGRSGFRIVRYLRLWDRGCHNVYVDDKLLVYNASAVGDFVAVDLETERVRRRISFPGHAKGLSVQQGHFVIGFSDFTERRFRKTDCHGYLAVIDRSSLETVATVDINHASLPQPIGNVNEIRCLDAPEYGHSRPEPIDRDWHKLRLSGRDWRYQVTSRLRRLKGTIRGARATTRPAPL